MASKKKGNPPKRGKKSPGKRDISPSDAEAFGVGQDAIGRDPTPRAAESNGIAGAERAAANGVREAEISMSETARHTTFPVVGIGASAGGLEALQVFFGNMPFDSGAAFVVVTHQHPGHVSLLPDLLSKVTKMPVAEARDGLVVEPNHVYVGPPGGLLAITSGVLRHLESGSTLTPHLPIDYFFRSLAADQREHAICVVLSGTALTAHWECGPSRRRPASRFLKWATDYGALRRCSTC